MTKWPTTRRFDARRPGRLCVLALWTLTTLPAMGQIPFGGAGTFLADLTIVGPLTGSEIHFDVYLPPGYAESSDRFPVAYFLHGFSASPTTGWALSTAFDGAIVSAQLPPMIFVFPRMGFGQFWGDSASGLRPTETNVVRELIPFIDATYRTKALRRFRLVAGWSQGGRGALLYGLKFPEMFSGVVTFEAALDYTWEEMSDPANPFYWWAENVFGLDESYFNQFDPWHLAEAYPALAAESPIAIQSVVGIGPFPDARPDLVAANATFDALAHALGIPSAYVETYCGHFVLCHLQDGGAEIFGFMTERLSIADIDVNPGSFRNTIRLDRPGLVPVAILSDEYFDALTQLRPKTVDVGEYRFGDAAPVHDGHVGDVDEDGDLDVVLHFEVDEIGLVDGDLQVCLTGPTASGVDLRACEIVVIP